ncbi:MAG: DJ-1/PfpI family protein [Sphingomonadales bacterium]|nr:DJ-1/PfpI family protein [Sphingomonadales bacterium]
MARILIILPQTDYDPSEVALPWLVWSKAGHEVCFATEAGRPAACDAVTLTGEGLPLLARSLQARVEAREAYAEMLEDRNYNRPLSWTKVRVSSFDAFHFPGGHAPGMRSYCESPEVQRIAREVFAANKPVSAVCHGVLPLARAGVLVGRRTTALTEPQEKIAIQLTDRALPGHYRTYPKTVEAEVRHRMRPGGLFERGGLFPRYAGKRNPEAGFVVRDENYLSARWPGDAWTLALRMNDLLDGA